MNEYPEHDKLAAVKDQSQAIGQHIRARVIKTYEQILADCLKIDPGQDRPRETRHARTTTRNQSKGRGMTPFIVRQIEWLRINGPRHATIAILLLTISGILLHVLAAALNSFWFIPVDLFSSLLLIVAGGVLALVAVWSEEERHPPVDVWTIDNTTPGPSAESGGLYLSHGEILVDPSVISPGTWNTEPPQVAAETDEPFGSHYPILAETHEEMLRQLDTWGEQNHPNGTGGQTARLNRTNAKKAVDAAAEAGDGSLTWAMILKEEFTEALAEDDLVKLDDELVQIMAVAGSWRLSIARQMADAIGVEANPQ